MIGQLSDVWPLSVGNADPATHSAKEVTLQGIHDAIPCSSAVVIGVDNR